MCTKALWSAIGGRGPLPKRDGLMERTCRLQAWSARELITPIGPVVVALEETTYLTLVFPLVNLPDFTEALAEALAAQLGALGVSHEAIANETAAILNRSRFARNDNRSLLGSVNDVAFHTLVRLEASRRLSLDALRRVQAGLNGMPHVNRKPSFPDQATTLLFSGPGSVQ
jgi:hypothetical protein